MASAGSTVFIGGKPKFRTRTSVVTEARIRALEAFGGSPIPHSDYHLILEDYIRSSIGRSDRPYPMFRLQTEILTELMAAESTVGDYKKKLTELEAAKAPESDVNYVKCEMVKYKRLKFALRDVGDGIAWRLLNFDRCVISHLGVRARKQHLNPDGMNAELFELGNLINKHNEVALLNDLTNILKKGDITAKLPDGSFEFVEVKSSGNKGSRVVRQKRDLEQTVRFFNNREKHERDLILKVMNFRLEPKAFMGQFELMLSRAEARGGVCQKVGDHLLVTLIDLKSKNPDSDSSIFLGAQSSIVKEWSERGDFYMEFLGIDRYAHVQNFAPFSIFPIAYKFRAKLMTGAIHLSTVVNVSAVLRYFSTRGWRLIRGPESFYNEDPQAYSINESVAAVAKGPVTIFLPAAVVGRLGHEFLSVKTLVDLCDSIHANGDSCKASAIFPNFEYESRQWD